MSAFGSAASAFVTHVWLISASVSKVWAQGGEGAVPNRILREAIATTSAAGNAATYLANEIETLQHALAAANIDILPFVAAPTGEVAAVERGIDRLHRKLEEYIPRELAQLNNIARAMEHIVEDLTAMPGNSPDSPGEASSAAEKLTSGQKEANYRKVVQRHLKDLIKLVATTVQHREGAREDPRWTKKQVGNAGDAFEELDSDIVEAKGMVEGSLIDAGGHGDSSVMSQGSKQKLISDLDDLGKQIWLQHAETKARESRAEKFAAACHLEVKDLRYLQEDMVLLRERVAYGETGVVNAATQVLDSVRLLIKGIKEKHLLS
ncbi:hypothetical protein B0T26DRAFT_757958 [Lasiosphaeria miniovina]|uniref:Vinculin n=1 Tax=Lasiosphaeria miniovina TaxID=1954250 RepID=A0AA39ZQZ4_9PEZI|nr:uncharacterized protein B0T26DRAFT_757958 [Lasiosphaeria miniovina]KAK0701993.1 hypothetical protein B0T26DRAFT_757958 [Lasiosphaeria miniovina]